MEAVMDLHVVKTILTEFDDLTKNPEIYVEQHLENSEKFKLLTKKLFDFTIAANSLTGLTAKSLSKLLIKGFDFEQIWQQIEIQNNSAVPFFSKAISSIDPENISLGAYRPAVNSKEIEVVNKFSVPDSSEKKSNTFDENVSDSASKLNKVSKKLLQDEYIFDDDSDSSDIFEANTDNIKENLGSDYDDDDMPELNDQTFEEDEDDDDDSVEMSKLDDQEDKVSAFEDEEAKLSIEETKLSKKKSTLTKKSYRTEVDDQFFKLSKLEEFLRIEDLKEEKQTAEDASEEDDINLFQDIPSESDLFDEESDQEEGKKTKSSKDLMYEDFFDVPESGDDNESEQLQENMEVDEESSDNEEEEIQDDEKTVNDSGTKEFPQNLPDSKSSQKTAFELEQEIIKKKIGEYEKSMLEPLPWHLTGEVAASSRPVDSLIHHEADFESNVKQDHVTDNTLNESIENFIKKQIGNRAFQDVERKYKPTEEMIAYRKEVALDQTKSKKGLAEVYEDEYLKKQTKQEEEENPKHKEIKQLMDSLFPELQALFSHIPKPAVPEIKVVSNLPAVTVEEVAPVSVSDATLLAPEEVKPKSGLVKGQTERTDTDRKRERRKKKVLQKVKAKKAKEKLEAQKANPSARKSKLEKLEILKKLKQHRNTKIAQVNENGKVKSSKDFFSRLQDTVDSKMKSSAKNSTKKKVL